MSEERPGGLRSVAGLRAVGTAANVPAGAAFCARCGRAPDAAPPMPASRVCRHCGLGLVLRAPAQAAPSPQDAFLVADRVGRVSAMSATAEVLLGLSEQAAQGRPVGELVSAVEDAPHSRHDFLASLRAAAAGVGPVRHFQGWAGAPDGTPRSLRVGPCGPPPGALLVIVDEHPRSAPSG